MLAVSQCASMLASHEVVWGLRTKAMPAGTNTTSNEKIDIRTLLVEEAGHAGRRLARPEPPDVLIHDARKYCKRWRSYIRLLPPAQRRMFDSVDREIGASAKSLSPVRDASVLAQTADSFGAVPEAAPKPSDATAAHALSTFRRRLEEIRRRATNIPASSYEPSPARLIKSFERFEKAYAENLKTRSSGQLHHWRKQTQRLRYQLLQMGPAHFPVRYLAKRLGRVADLLGDDHDLVVLAAHLGRAPQQARLLQAKRQQLQQDAFDLTGKLVASQAWPLLHHGGRPNV